MTRVSYVLANGTEVATLKEAQKSGMSYATGYIRVPKEKPMLTEKSKAMRIKI